MKKFFNEFKEFIARGNVMDMAVGMVVGAAFTAIVTSLVNNIIMPLISCITGGVNFESWNVALGAGEEPPVLGLGTFVAAILNFVIVAFVIFLVIKGINNLHKKKEVPAAPAAPTTKKCPYCFSEIPIEATKCPHCTSDIPKEA